MSITLAAAQRPLPNLPPPQSAKAALSVHVSDQSGAVLPNATIQLRDNETGKERTVTTNANGDFSLDKLFAGKYQVTISEQGFKSAIYKEMMLSADETKKIDVTLNIANLGPIVGGAMPTVPTDLPALPNQIR